MRGYTEIITQAQMEALLDRMRSFHDSMAKELHIVNRGNIEASGAMVMSHRFDARLLMQSQWKVRAIELLFVEVESLRTGDPGEFWAASGHIVTKTIPFEQRRVSMSFDARFEICAERLFVHDREAWSGAEARFGEEVPDPRAVPASIMFDDWRQCSACADGFEVPTRTRYALCPACGAMTELDLG